MLAHLVPERARSARYAALDRAGAVAPERAGDLARLADSPEPLRHHAARQGVGAGVDDRAHRPERRLAIRGARAEVGDVLAGEVGARRIREAERDVVERRSADIAGVRAVGLGHPIAPGLRPVQVRRLGMESVVPERAPGAVALQVVRVRGDRVVAVVDQAWNLGFLSRRRGIWIDAALDRGRSVGLAGALALSSSP